MIQAHDVPPLSKEATESARTQAALSDELVALARQFKGASGVDLVIRCEAAQRKAHYLADQGA